MTAREYGLTTRGLRADRVRVGLPNAGRQPHHMIAFPYDKGATFVDAKAFFAEEGEPTGSPPVDFAGAVRTAALEGGDAQVADLSLERGKSAPICLLTGRAGGPPHLVTASSPRKSCDEGPDRVPIAPFHNTVVATARVPAGGARETRRGRYTSAP